MKIKQKVVFSTGGYAWRCNHIITARLRMIALILYVGKTLNIPNHHIEHCYTIQFIQPKLFFTASIVLICTLVLVKIVQRALNHHNAVRRRMLTT